MTTQIDIVWVQLAQGNQIVGQTIAETDLRSRTGASVIVIMCNNKLISNPKSQTILDANDRIGLIGDRDQIETAKI